jgi:hypothetical protein
MIIGKRIIFLEAGLSLTGLKAIRINSTADLDLKAGRCCSRIGNVLGFSWIFLNDDEGC